MARLSFDKLRPRAGREELVEGRIHKISVLSTQSSALCSMRHALCALPHPFPLHLYPFNVFPFFRLPTSEFNLAQSSACRGEVQRTKTGPQHSVLCSLPHPLSFSLSTLSLEPSAISWPRRCFQQPTTHNMQPTKGIQYLTSSIQNPVRASFPAARVPAGETTWSTAARAIEWQQTEEPIAICF